MTLLLDELDYEALLALCWAAPLTTTQLQRIAAPRIDPSNLRKRLRAMKHANVIDGHLYHRRREGQPPQRVGWVWAMTRPGFEMLPEDARRPPKPAILRRSLIEHDLIMGELLALIVERTRGQLSGLHLQREVRLDREKLRPKCDAILMLYRHPNYAHPIAPWHTDPPTDGEKIRGWAIEVDRDTEPLAVITEKARAYQRIASDPTFFERYGRMPVPLWVVPTDRRARLVTQAWHSVWPAGRWLMTTSDRLGDLIVTEYRDGAQRMHSLLDGWTQPAA